MLRMLYLVPAEDYRPSPPRIGRKRPRRRSQRPKKLHSHIEWFKLRTKHREAELRRNALTKEVADYMKQIMPTNAIPHSRSPPPTYGLPKLKSKSRRGALTNVTAASLAADTHILQTEEIIH